MASTPTDTASSMDPILHVISCLPFSLLPSPSPDNNPAFPDTRTLSPPPHFSVVSSIIYDVIVEPPGIGSTQDPNTGTVRPVVFLPGRVNGQYIIEGLSSGFMFVLGGFGIMLLDLALDNSKNNNRDKSVKMSYGCAGGAFLVVSYIMSMLFLRIKIPAYLR